MILTSDKGKQFQLGRTLGKGGEGTAYLLTSPGSSNPSVAKMYHRPLSDAQIAKLRRMVSISDQELLNHSTWPISLLFKANEHKPCGFEMPFCKGDELHEIYGPASRKSRWSDATWEHLIVLARNLSCAFDTFHSKDVVVGDVNEKNILFQPDYRIKLVDCDSYQVINGNEIYPCRVGVPLYTPPELQGMNFAHVKRTTGHDSFGLAIMIFQLLFMGRHPYAGVNKSAQYLDIETGGAIKAGLYAFGNFARTQGVTPPPKTLPISTVTAEIQFLFERAFSRNSIQRPVAKEWAFCLEQMRSKLVTCRRDKSHRYSNHLSECPWCLMSDKEGVHLFISIAVSPQINLSGLDVASFQKAINQIVKEKFDVPQLISFAANFKPSFTKLPSGITGVTFGFFGGLGIIFGAIFFAAVAGSSNSLLILIGIVSGISMMISGWHKEAYKQEKKIRDAKFKQAKTKMDSLFKELNALISAYETGFTKLHNELNLAFKRYCNLPNEKNNQLRQLEQKKRDIQLEQFLDTFLIVRHKIRGIGKVREKMLISYGIETAADITERKVTAIPGFRGTLYEALKQWRLEKERRFVFDPRKPVPQAAIDDLHKKLATLQIDLQETQRNLLKKIVDLGNRTKVQRLNMIMQLEQISREFKQAEIDIIK